MVLIVPEFQSTHQQRPNLGVPMHWAPALSLYAIACAFFAISLAEHVLRDPRTQATGSVDAQSRVIAHDLNGGMTFSNAHPTVNSAGASRKLPVARTHKWIFTVKYRVAER